MKKGRGIQRHESLAPLSRHHHHALFLCLNLKRVNTEKARYSIQQVAEDVKRFWEEGGQEHFREEEEVLLPAYSQYAALEHAEIAEMLLEHVEIRGLMHRLIEKINHDELSTCVEDMRELGEKLEAHVRKEERVIFPLIEKALPDDVLKELEPYFHE